MSYFTTRKVFLTPSFDLNKKEEEKILKFLRLLENSNVSDIIEKNIKNNKGKGGRPSVNYYNMFATILYGFAFGRDSLRDLEEACKVFVSKQNRDFVHQASSRIQELITNGELVDYRKIQQFGKILGKEFITIKED